MSDASKMPAEGDKAPAFKLPASTGGDVSLKDYQGKPVVVYFYPRADTPGCTTQACGFRDSADEYDKAGVGVVGISPDPIKAVDKFAKKHDLNFPLLADEDHAVCEAYGVWGEKKMYGKTYLGAARTTFLIDAKGVVRKVFEKVKPAGHEAEVLEAAKGL